MGANGNRKTTESFAKEVENLTNGEYVLTGDYIYSNIETTIKHLKCGKEFIVKPTNFCRTDRGIRCPYCSKANNKRKTTKEFQDEVKTINPNIVVLGEYKGNKIKILMKDLICGRTFESKPNAFLSRQHCRCPLCSMEHNYSSKKQMMSLKEAKNKLNQELGKDYEIIGDYNGTHKKCNILHKKCGNIWNTTLSSIFSNHSKCPYCSGHKKKTQKEFELEVQKLKEFKVVGKYINNRTKICIEHIKCGRKFLITPYGLLSNKSCPLCGRELAIQKITMTEKACKQKLKTIVGDEYKIVGNYIGCSKKVDILHTKCNKIWNTPPISIFQGRRCPYCAPNHSKKEDFILEYLNKNFPNLHPVKLKKKIPMYNKMFEIDIFIPELNIGFEYNGIYWHSILRKDKNYHKEKQKAFKSMGITLYFLWEHWEIDDCLNIIKHILTKDNQIEVDPYIKMDRKYLYANKDLYPEKPPYIEGYKYIKEIMKPEVVSVTDNKIFTIYNSGYYQYIKQ